MPTRSGATRRTAFIGLCCLATSLAATGCGGELTELLVVVDSDLAVPSELDSVQVMVSGLEMGASGAITNTEPLPRTVGVVHRGGGLGPVEVTVIGSRGGTEVVRARAVTWFVRGQTLVLPMFLSRQCTGVTCPSGRTCSGGACVSASVDPATLAVWNGTVPRLDGGDPSADSGPPPDGGPVCAPITERCNGVDDDCDGAIDEEFDLEADPLNCGGCGDVCMLAGAMEGCAAGVCTVASCNADVGDCNADASDGCEADLLTSALHCGACDAPCAPANGTGTCTGGACALDACDAGFGDCNADETDGCELALVTLTDCGACGMACTATGGTPTCATGTCAIETCDDPTLGDCNADASDGCELTLDALTDCGGCGVTCDLAGASETCATGTCEIVACDAGFDDCDGDPANGCETALTTLTDCGACGMACSIPGEPETCATGTCLVACASGRGDCDTSRSNGCETNTRTSETHCGMCGNACAAGDNCNSGVCN